MKGLHSKYKVEKVNGETDPDAIYFVLRLDTDPLARQVVRHYSQLVQEENLELAKDLMILLNRLDGLNV